MKIIPREYNYYDFCDKLKNNEVGSEKCLKCKHLIKNDMEGYKIICHIFYNKNKKEHYFIHEGNKE